MSGWSSGRWAWALCSGVFLLLTVVGVGSYRSGGEVYRLVHPGVSPSVDGHRSTPGPLRPWLEGLAGEWQGPDKLIFDGSRYEPVPARELGFELDVEATLQKLEAAAAPERLFVRLRRAALGLLTGGAFAPAATVDVSSVVHFEPTAARRLLEGWAPTLYRPAVNARLEETGRVDDAPGQMLDVEATLRHWADLPPETEVLALSLAAIPAEVRSADLPQVDPGRVLASFDTDLSRKRGPRMVNIRRAAELLNGYIIEPGALFSFNRVVGDRTHENGFIDAPVIVNDAMEPGVGGGVCQVASTLHGAAVFGGLEVVRRRSHSRPSGYAPLGLDATVIYGEVDLRIRNTHPVPLIVRAYLPSRYVVRVELRGLDPVATVDHHYDVVGKHDFYRRVIEDPSLGPGEIKRTQKGSFGLDVVSTVTTVRSGTTRRHRYRSKYYPVPEIFKVGPGTSVFDLPELPPGATHVQSEATPPSAEPSPVEG